MTMTAMGDHDDLPRPDQQRVPDALDRELQDPEAWDWDTPVELTAAPNRTLTLSVRLDRDDARLLGLGAEQAGRQLTEYLVWSAKHVTRVRLQAD